MIQKIDTDKKRYLDLLLEADPDEAMIDRYLEAGEMYVLFEKGQPLAEAVLLDRGRGVCELMNLAVRPGFQGQGWGGLLIRHLFHEARSRFHTMLVGTADASDRALRVYQREGFTIDHRIPGFFTENYPHPNIEENGIPCVDMIVMKMKLREG